MIIDSLMNRGPAASTGSNWNPEYVIEMSQVTLMLLLVDLAYTK